MEVCPNSSAFVPTSLVTAFHNIPHVDINLNQNVTEFENTLEYYETIIIWACVPILAIVCIFILMSVYFICVCCCCCCQQHEKRSKCSRASCGVLVSLLLLLALACCGVALWAEFTLDSNVNRSTEAANSANSLIQDVLTMSQTLDFDSVAADVSNLSDAISNTPASTPMRTEAMAAVSAIQTELPDLDTAFTEIQSNADIEDFSVTLDAIDFIELVRHWAVVAYVIVTIIMLLLVALSVCCSAGCRSPVCMVIVLVFLGLYTLTMWVAVGANLAYLVVAGDICSNPDRLITMQFTSGGAAANLPESQLQYYLVCDEDCYANPFSDFQMDAVMALETISSQQSVVMSYANNNSFTEVQDLLYVVEASFNSATSAIDNITMLTNCTDLNSDYLTVLDGLCADGYMFSLILFAMACGLAIFLILLLCFGSFYAGLLSKGKTFDDETIVYDFPNEDGPSPWQTYGARQQYHSTTTQYNTNEFNMSGNAVEPPKYTDLHQESRMDNNAANGRTSGSYDALQ